MQLEQLRDQIHRAAEEARAMIVEGFIRAEETASPFEFIVNFDTALAIIANTSPLIVYLRAETLQLEALVAGEMDDLDAHEDAETIRSIRKAAKSLQSHEGEIGRIVAHFFIGPTLHTAIESAPWLVAFEEELDLIREQAEARSEIALATKSASERALVDRLARQLIAEPAFSSGRTSFAKRLLLAREMFPGNDEVVLRDVVTVAEGLQWLAQSGFKS